MQNIDIFNNKNVCIGFDAEWNRKHYKIEDLSSLLCGPARKKMWVYIYVLIDESLYVHMNIEKRSI